MASARHVCGWSGAGLEPDVAQRQGRGEGHGGAARAPRQARLPAGPLASLAEAKGDHLAAGNTNNSNKCLGGT